VEQRDDLRITNKEAASVMTSLANYQGIARLRLTEDHLPALAEQGSVYQEQHRGKSRYKLRFRTPGGRQVVRYIPNHLVEFVQVDLNILQSGRNAVRALREATRGVHQTRREAKRQLQPVLHELGYHFHGASIRRRRKKQFTSLSESIHQKELKHGRF
jgi:hypothetical protein